MYDILYYTDTHNIPGMLFQIDFEKSLLYNLVVIHTKYYIFFGFDTDGFMFLKKNKNIKSSVIVNERIEGCQ